LVPIEKATYDLHLGTPKGTVGHVNQKEIAMWHHLTTRRVDVIIRVNGVNWLVEVKPVASMSAVGQLLTYLYLLRRDRDDLLPVIPVCIAAKADDDLREVFASLRLILLTLDQPRAQLLEESADLGFALRSP
jgi:hypothetical protein